MAGIVQRFKSAFGAFTQGASPAQAKDAAPAEAKAAGGWFNVVAPDGRSVGGREDVDPYSQCLYASSAINKIGQNIASVPLQVHGDQKRGKAAIADPRIDAWLAAPAKGFKWSQFIQATNCWLKTRGKFYWLMGDEWLLSRSGASLPPLILANPNRMFRHRSRYDELLDGWSYIDDRGKTHVLQPENVIEVKYFNPRDPEDGLSPLRAAAPAVEASFFAGRFHRNAMKTNGEKGAIVYPKGAGVHSEPQRKQIEALLRRQAEMRRQGEVSPVFFSAEVEVKDPEIMPIDASFFEGLRLTGEQIYLSLDLPPSMSGKFESNSIGSASDYYRALTEAYMPTADTICDAIDTALSALLRRPVFSSFDWTDHPTMQQVREAKTETAVKYWSMGMPLKSVSDYLGLGLPRSEGDEIGYLPFAVAPVGSAALGDPAQDPATAEEPPPEEIDLDEDEDIKTAFKSLADMIDLPDLQIKAPDRSVAAAEWRRQMKLRRPWQAKFEAAFRRELMGIRKEVLANIERQPEIKSLETKAGIADDLNFNVSTFRATLLQRLRGVAAAALQDAGASEWKHLGRQDPFNQPAPFVREFLASREPNIAGMADTVWRDVQRSLQRGIDAGESMAKLSGRVRQTFNGVSKVRGATIAQTETGIVFEAARAKAQRDAGVRHKMWLTTGGDNVRDTHRAMNKQRVPIDQPFVTPDGEQLMHPCDSSLGASADEIINCHCISVAVRRPQ